MNDASETEIKSRLRRIDHDADYVIHRLERAGKTILTIPGDEATKMYTSAVSVIHTALEAYGWNGMAPLRPASQSEIDMMNEALNWIALIPQDRYVLRRVVGARALVHPVSGRHLFPWRRLGNALGADHKAIQRWHANGIDLIVAALKRGESDEHPDRR